MARAIIPDPSLIEAPPKYRVVVNGTERPEGEVLRVMLRAGLLGAEAVVMLPQARAGDPTTGWTDALLEIYSSRPGEVGAGPIFRGYVVGPENVEDESRSDVMVLARSIVDVMDRVHAFQATALANTIFRARDRWTGAVTGLTLGYMVRQIFSSRSLDAAWRQLVGLGDTTVIDGVTGGGDYLELSDVRFTTNTMVQALRRLLAFVPDISFRERYATNGQTLIDFFQWGAQTTGERVLVAANEDQPGPAQGAYVTAYVSKTDNKQAVSRVIGFGAPTQFMVTLSTDNSGALGDSHPSPTLVPFWENATLPYPAGKTYTDEGLTSGEREVLLEPSCADNGSPWFRPGLEFHFRRYRVPVALRKVFEMLGQNGLERTLFGVRSPLEIQLFRQKVILAESETPGEMVGQVLQFGFEKLSGWSYEPRNGVLALAQPALYEARTTPYGVLYAPAHIYWTVTLRSEVGRADTWPSRPMYDTGVRGDMARPGLRTTGTVDSWENLNIERRQIGAKNIPDADGNLHDFSARWYEEIGQGYITVYANGSEDAGPGDYGSPQVIRDDSDILATLCERRLKERSRRRTEARVYLPYTATSFRPGDVIRVLNRGIDNVRLTIAEVEFDFYEMTTMIFATDEIPPRLNVEAATPGRRGTREVTKGMRATANEMQMQERMDIAGHNQGQQDYWQESARRTNEARQMAAQLEERQRAKPLQKAVEEARQSPAGQAEREAVAAGRKPVAYEPGGKPIYEASAQGNASPDGLPGIPFRPRP
jgi:hypothetical protein